MLSVTQAPGTSSWNYFFCTTELKSEVACINIRLSGSSLPPDEQVAPELRKRQAILSCDLVRRLHCNNNCCSGMLDVSLFCNAVTLDQYV